MSSPAADQKAAPTAPEMEGRGHVPLQLDIFGEDGHLRTLREIEADVINFALCYYGGRMSEVARRLRVSRSTLYRKIDPTHD